MRKTVILAWVSLLAVLFSSCRKQPQFTISGKLLGADGEWIYLEHTALTETTKEDSCCLTESGTFCLHGTAPAYPDFYRLRVGSDYAVLLVDSVEAISVNTSIDSLSLTRNIHGSDESVKIAELRSSLRENDIDSHRLFAQEVIMQMPRSMVAYYAVFQRKQGMPVFDMANPEQRKYYQVVATSMQVWMPEYVRTTTLYSQVIAAMNEERILRNNLTMRQYIDDSESAFLDIALPNIYGDTCRLSEHRGKVILLDFSSSEMEQGNAYILALRELDNLYHRHGLDIFSVGVEPVQLYWEDWVRNLPWTCVRAETIAPLRTYNVSTLPTLFVIDRNGVVQGRYTDFDEVEKAIKRVL